jgi:electron transfer flavoprotein beta subunit
MNVVVLVKYVPNPSGDPPEIGPDHRLRREEASGALDPSDAPGVEIALRLVETGGGEVTVVSMGPEPAMTAVSKALAMGADRGMLITDSSLRGADVLATARVLAAAIERVPFDLVVAGVESTDGGTGTMPMTLAAMLGLPSATFARRVVLEDRNLVIERQTSSGYDVVECALPAVVTVTAGIAEPRLASLREIVAAKRKPMERLSLTDLGLSPEDVRPTQEIVGLEFASDKRTGEIIDDPADAAARIVQFLEDAAVIQR